MSKCRRDHKHRSLHNQIGPAPQNEARQPAPTAASTNLRVIQAYRQGDATPATLGGGGRPQADHHTSLEREPRQRGNMASLI